MAGRYAPGGDTFRIAVVALVVGIVVGLLVRFVGDTAVGTAVLFGVLAGTVSTVLVGPARNRRPARSNSSS